MSASLPLLLSDDVAHEAGNSRRRIRLRQSPLTLACSILVERSVEEQLQLLTQCRLSPDESDPVAGFFSMWMEHALDTMGQFQLRVCALAIARLLCSKQPALQAIQVWLAFTAQLLCACTLAIVCAFAIDAQSALRPACHISGQQVSFDPSTCTAQVPGKRQYSQSEGVRTRRQAQSSGATAQPMVPLPVKLMHVLVQLLQDEFSQGDGTSDLRPFGEAGHSTDSDDGSDGDESANGEASVKAEVAVRSASPLTSSHATCQLLAKQ